MIHIECTQSSIFLMTSSPTALNFQIDLREAAPKDLLIQVGKSILAPCKLELLKFKEFSDKLFQDFRFV